jgi:uncharacterized SAM-binding protein YcdF (DUF218 family)
MTAAAFSRKLHIRTRLAVTALVMLFLFTNPLIINRLFTAYQPPPVRLKRGETYEAGILLGGFVSYDRYHSTPYFNASSDRFIQTLLLYKEGHIRKIIVSGGDAVFAGDGYREADYVVEKLRAAGVEQTDILADREARNTIENSRNAGRIADSAGFKGPYLLITSAFHMPRALSIFRGEGLEVSPYPCAYMVLHGESGFNWKSFTPSAKSLDLWQMYLKEQLGKIYYTLRK